MANYRAGSAYISITPSMRGFNEKVRAEVAKIRDVKINVDVDVPNKPVTVPTHDPTIRPKVDNSRAFRAIASLESRLDRLARGRFLINLGVAMAPLAIPALAAGGAGALGLGAVGAVAGGGAIGFAAIAKAQIDKLKLQQKAMGKAQQALQQAQSLSPTTKAGAASKAAQVAEAKKNLTGLQKSMTPLESKSLDAMGKLSSSWNKFLVSVEGPTLGALNKGMTALTQLMKPLGAFIKPVAKALGDVFAQIGKAGSSKGMVSFAKTMGQLSGSLLKKAVPILGDLATGFKNLLLAFLPVGTDMVGGLGKLAKRFADWSATVGKSQGFRSFIDYVRENGPKLMSTIGDVVTAVVNLGVALAPLASKVLAGVSAFAKWLSGFSKAHPTIIRVVAGVIALSSGLSALAGPASKVIGLIRVAATVFRVLSAVLLTNPIGLIVTAIVGLGIALVVAYKKSETFRKIVDAAFNAIGRAARWLWNKAIAPMVRFIIGGFAAIADKIGDMLDALSHIPGFGWAKAAADKMHGAARGARDLADKIRDIPTHHSTRLDINWQSAKLGVQQVQSAINALHDRHVTITVSQRNLFNRQAAMAGAMHHASGGTVAGQRRPYGDKVLTALAPGEEVISNRRGQADRHRNLLKMINAGALADGGTVRPILFAQGGVGKAAGGTITKPAAFARAGADGQQGPLVQVVAGPRQSEQEIGTIAARQVMWGMR